jgi:hypothetical protein
MLMKLTAKKKMKLTVPNADARTFPTPTPRLDVSCPLSRHAISAPAPLPQESRRSHSPTPLAPPSTKPPPPQREQTFVVLSRSHSPRAIDCHRSHCAQEAEALRLWPRLSSSRPDQRPPGRIAPPDPSVSSPRRGRPKLHALPPLAPRLDTPPAARVRR